MAEDVSEGAHLTGVDRGRNYVKTAASSLFRGGGHNRPGGNSERGITGVPTDQKLLQFFYEAQGIDAHAIATDSFLDKSRNEYNAAWLSRELIQNFVDHNPAHPGTLDGVRFTSENLPTGGKRFRIEGQWPFEDPTGVLSPHSDKPDMHTAGGNGIGLKQSAIRFMRDFDVQRFEIDGEGWSVNYHLAKADDVNQAWENVTKQRQSPDHKVKHDWLLADIQETRNRGSNAYIIETNNAELIQAFEQLPTLGVSTENPYLQNIDYVNEHGGIKWLPKPAPGQKEPRGRLFVNGQVMNYKEHGETAEDYWVGPELVTLQLNNVDYRMSVDRPPVNGYDLRRYVSPMVEAMSKDDILQQLKRSEYIWAGMIDSNFFSDRKGASVVIEALTQRLPWTGYDKSEWQEHFGEKKYICWDRGVEKNQILELEKQGYIVCPSYFEQLGMDKASSKLNSTEIASNEAPKLRQYERERLAKEYGMIVAREEFSDVTNPSQFIQLMGERLSNQLTAIEISDTNPNIIRLKLKSDIPKQLLFHALPNPKGDEQKLLYLLRGMAAYGLEKDIFHKIFTSQSEFVTTFGLDFDSVTRENVLLARNVENSNDQGAFVEIELSDQYGQQFRDVFQRNKAQTADVTVSTPPADRGTPAPGTPAQGEPGAHPAQRELPGDRAFIVSISDGAWTPEQEMLYRAAIQKRQREEPLSDKERAIIQARRELLAHFASIPVEQPALAGTDDGKGEVKQKDARLSDAEQARVQQIDQQLPGILAAISQLEEIVPESGPEALTGQSAIEKYLQWRDSGEFYGQLGGEAGYLTGRHLFELIESQNQAEIPVVDVQRTPAPEDRIRDALRERLGSLVDQMNSEEDDVDEFDIVLAPTEKQLAQLGLLRLYVQLTTGVALPNDLFIYQGTGSKGINLGQKALGLHESLFSVKFSEAMRTFVHEVAHNTPEASDHGNEFRHAMESLFAITIDRLSDIADKLESGSTLTQEERIILDMRREWENLKAA